MGSKTELIRQALGAAEASIKLAKQLLLELEGGVGNKVEQPKKEWPGILGTFDGESMVTADGQKFPVPQNYASKSLLVVGDTLKLVDEGGQKRFKQIEHMKRHKTNGVLAKKDGKWAVVASEGSYKVLPVSVEHFGGRVGDQVLLQLPANNLTVPYGAVETITKNDESNKEDVPEAKIESTAPKPIEKEAKEAVKEPKKEKTPDRGVKAVAKEKKEEKPTVLVPEVKEARALLESSEAKSEEKPKETTKTPEKKAETVEIKLPDEEDELS